MVMQRSKSQELDSWLSPSLQVDPQRFARNGDIGIDQKQHQARMPFRRWDLPNTCSAAPRHKSKRRLKGSRWNVEVVRVVRGGLVPYPTLPAITESVPSNPSLR